MESKKKEEIRYIRRDDWIRIIKKTIIIEDFKYKQLKGKISLLRMDEVTQPLIIANRTIVDKGYYWMQIAFENQYFWMTCMFDNNDTFIDIYVDMTNGNVVNVDNPYFRDMYLDFDVFEEGVFELDRDELDEAYHNNEITKEEYDRTLEEGKKLKAYLTENHSKLIQEVKEKFLELKKRL